MATGSRGKIETRNQESSPGRTMVWVERKSSKDLQKVDVVYYLSRNGQLEHPHFIEVPLSSPQGLFLKDVISRLNSLRGEGMANRYSWSSKRSYKNGFVWQDLSEPDYIYPCQGKEYILKGSQLLETSLSVRSRSASSTSSSSKNSSETYSSSEDSNVPSIMIRMKHHSWSESKELDEHKLSNGNVSTQTEENEEEHQKGSNQSIGYQSARPSSNSNSEMLATLKLSADIRDQSADNDRSSGRIKASAVLIQLIACGSRRVKECESMEMKVGP